MTKDLSIVCVDCINHEQAARILEHCGNIFPVKEIKLLTDKPVITTAKVEIIPKISSNEGYSEFVLTSLYKHISTDKFIVVQTDGYILKPSAWIDDFAKYDFIGSPWDLHPLYYMEGLPICTVSNRVGNGGFSLRSKRIMEMAGPLWELARRPKGPEDMIICRLLRNILLSDGITFAPYELAKKFSVENKPYEGQFGYHGKLTEKINNWSGIIAYL